MRRRLAFWAAILFGAGCALAQTPLVEFRFNETGTNATNTGTSPGAALFTNTNGVPSDFHSAAGAASPACPTTEPLTTAPPLEWAAGELAPISSSRMKQQLTGCSP